MKLFSWDFFHEVLYGAQYYHILPFEKDYGIKGLTCKDLMIEIICVLPEP
jgi:hypothetical protein